MYTENETLILLQNVGKEGKLGFIPKGTEVTFIKAVDDKNNLSKSIIVIQFEDKQLALPELALKPKKDKTIETLKEFNKRLMKRNPNLKRYHHNAILRTYFMFTSILHTIFIKPFIKVFELLTRVEPKNQDEKLVNEIKALMKED